MESDEKPSICKKFSWLFKKRRKVRPTAVTDDQPNNCKQQTTDLDSDIVFEHRVTTVPHPSSPASLPLTVINNAVTAQPTIEPHQKPIEELLRLNRIELLECGWYWGKLSRDGAQKKLNGKPNGSFLVRDSQSENTFTLSFRSSGVTLHCRISLDAKKQWSYIENVKSPSVVKLIEETMRRSESSVFGYVKQDSKLQAPFPVRLTNPINRFLEVQSLQSIARNTIRQHFKSVEFSKLPLPPVILLYLSESPPDFEV